MAQSIVGLDNVQPYKFSECSKADYAEMLQRGDGVCLLNKPNEVSGSDRFDRFDRFERFERFSHRRFLSLGSSIGSVRGT